MNLKDFFNIALENILINKLRSFLIILSIIIGVSTIIIFTSLTETAKERIMASISKIGTKLIFVIAGKPNSFSQYGRSNISLNWDTYEKIQKLPEVMAIVPQVGLSTVVRYKNKEINTYIFGVNENFLLVRDYKLLFGHFFSKYDNENGANVCVLGYSVYKKLERSHQIINKGIFIGNGNIYCRIIGVLKPKGQNFTVNQDDRIYVPINFLQNQIIQKKQIILFYVKLYNEKYIPIVKRKIRKILVKEYKKNAENFSVQSQNEILGTLNFISDTFTIFIFLIAFISLVVGGIGIMNIMLIAVNERKKEIGIRKAVGAKIKDIQYQFLLEAIIFTVLGGILGIITSFFILFILRYLIGWSFSISLFIILLSFFISFFIGLIFGYFPARKASKVVPAETLREL